MRKFILWIITALLLCGCSTEMAGKSETEMTCQPESKPTESTAADCMPGTTYCRDIIWKELEVLSLEDGYLDGIPAVSENEWLAGEADKTLSEWIISYDSFSALIRRDSATGHEMLHEYYCDGKIIRFSEPVGAWLMQYYTDSKVHVIQKGSPSGWYGENDSQTTVVLYGSKAWYYDCNPTASGYELYFYDNDGALQFRITNKAFEVQDIGSFIAAYESPEQFYSLTGKLSVSENGIEFLPETYSTAENLYQSMREAHPDQYSAPTYAEFAEQYKAKNP